MLEMIMVMGLAFSHYMTWDNGRTNGIDSSKVAIIQYQNVIDDMNEQRKVDETNKQLAYNTALVMRQKEIASLETELAEEIDRANGVVYEADNCISQPIHPEFNEWMQRRSDSRTD